MSNEATTTEAPVSEPSSSEGVVQETAHDEHQETDWAKVKADLRTRYREGREEVEGDTDGSAQDGAPPDAEAAPTEEPQPEPKTAAQRAKELIEAKRFEQEARREAKRREKAEQEAAELKSRLEALAADPMAALKHASIGDGSIGSFDELAQKLIKGELKTKTEQELKEEGLRKELDELKAWKSEQEQARVRAQQEAQVQEEVSFVKEQMELLADEMPFAGIVDWTANGIRQSFYEAQERGEEPDLRQLIRQANDAVHGYVRPMLTNERAVKALVADPEVKAALMKALGINQAAPQKRSALTATPVTRSDATGRAEPGNGPRTLTSTVKADMPNRAEAGEEDPEVLRRRTREAVLAWQRGLAAS